MRVEVYDVILPEIKVILDSGLELWLVTAAKQFFLVEPDKTGYTQEFATKEEPPEFSGLNLEQALHKMLQLAEQCSRCRYTVDDVDKLDTNFADVPGWTTQDFELTYRPHKAIKGVFDDAGEDL